ncbi:hypothetical protein ERO13_D06G093650v2 [Gossypium hirsutum]|uniref:Uncharacterized protein n=3 Tax=Gossypium TaxID=3633 RepID=A0A0D2UC91_GOSRA|nr:hypothetical protein ERO13_D06G093650v2 [Gossypium hirsutum]KJB65681.1 hypothetical protein B456_010G108100 [Gossypium raimondii]TYH66377.1 hypothetical protein ES332_D06G118700v1 [Gossypium tomentosum]TYI76930.1 hypothetical protein E1A91_D06G110800v1 [Gossypium mustelinum]
MKIQVSMNPIVTKIQHIPDPIPHLFVTFSLELESNDSFACFNPKVSCACSALSPLFLLGHAGSDMSL